MKYLGVDELLHIIREGGAWCHGDKYAAGSSLETVTCSACLELKADELLRRAKNIRLNQMPRLSQASIDNLGAQEVLDVFASPNSWSEDTIIFVGERLASSDFSPFINSIERDAIRLACHMSPCLREVAIRVLAEWSLQNRLIGYMAANDPDETVRRVATSCWESPGV